MYVVDPIKCYLIGGAAIAISLVAHSKKKKRLASWTATIATVQNVRRAGDGDASVSVRFSDSNGKPHTASVKVADGDSVSLGAELDISYNPQNPDEAFVRESKDMKLSFYIPLVAGIVLLALGVVSQITLSHAGFE